MRMSEASTVEEQLLPFIDVPTKFPMFIVNKNIT